MGLIEMRPVRAVFIVALAALTITGCARNQQNLPKDFTVNVGDRIFFDTDSSVIRADAQATLTRQAQWLNQYPNYAITVEGHADERGTREYNLALGARRAAATKAFLVGQGVNAARVNTISFGKERPVATCDAASCWNQNRRAVTLLAGQGS